MDFEEQKKIDERNDKIGKLLMRVKKINEVYNFENTTEEQRGELLINSKFILDQLVEFGYDRVVLESLLISGGDFLKSCQENGINLDTWGNVQLIFG